MYLQAASDDRAVWMGYLALIPRSTGIAPISASKSFSCALACSDFHPYMPERGRSIGGKFSEWR